MTLRLAVRLLAVHELATFLAILALSHAMAAPQGVDRSRPALVSFAPDKPNRVSFPPTLARCVRLIVLESENGQPCFDEVEVYGPGQTNNLAHSGSGARASASSCLPGYAIHQVSHLNDGRYGNNYSWIAAGLDRESVTIELPKPMLVSEIVFSRDRQGRYHDRLPTSIEIQLSRDGAEWRTVRRVATHFPRPRSGDWESWLHYAFLSEQQSWSRTDPDPPVSRVLKQMDAMVARMAGQGLDVSAERQALSNLRQRHARALTETSLQSAEVEAAYLETRLAKRRLFLRHPDLAAARRILFVARHPYEPSHNYSDILDAQWRPGGGVCVLEIPMADGRLIPETARVTRLFDAAAGVARDAMASFDARQVYFAYRRSPADYYHLYVVDSNGGRAHQLTEGPFHDYYPCPLPDQGIAFISTRCRARFLCWRPQAFVLFRMDPDGGNITPLSHANLSEWAPSVMQDGRILWTRSEYLDKGADFGHTLWAMHADGTHPVLIFGNNTRNCYVNAREVPGTDELCCTLISHGGDLNGPIGLIALAKGPFEAKAITNITPDTPPRYHMDWARRECFRDPIPVSRDFFLVSHAPQDHFGLYLIDRYGNRELIYMDPAIGSMCPTLLRPQTPPPVLAASPSPGLRNAPRERELGRERMAQAGAPGKHSVPETPEPGWGRFIVQDVYQGLEPDVPRGTIRFLRLCQEVRADLDRLPDGSYRQDHPSFEDFYASPTHLVRGPHGWPSYVAKASLGLVPVSPDGSAFFAAPAGKVLYFQALDQDLNEIQRMRSVVQLQPGEVRGCVGCHEHRMTTPPVRPAMALRKDPDSPAAPSWGAVPFAYERVVQPVWNAHCVRCHDARDPRKLDLTGTRGPDRVPASYRTLISQGWVHYFDYTWGQEHAKAPPLTFGTLKSRLWKLLEAGHYEVRLNNDEMHRIKCWIDLNCPLWPDYVQRQLRAEVSAAP